MVEPTPLRNADGSRPAGTGAPTGQVMAFPSKPPRLTAEEREFLPAALEVIETPFSPTLRLTAGVLCAIIVTALTWASLSHIDMVAVADGKVVPLGQIKVVQPLETAMIRAIRVDEGDHVTAGQLLVDLDPTEARADLNSLLTSRAQSALDAEVARLLINRDPNEPFHEPGGADPVLIGQSRDQARREIEKHLATTAAYEADIAQKVASLQANDAQIERARLTIPLLQEKNDVAKRLYEKGYGPRPPVLERKRAAAFGEARRAAQRRGQCRPDPGGDALAARPPRRGARRLSG
jgi:hemolysin D